MLYLPGDEENKLQRAKSFRVLCLCHIALLRYDRAAEFAIEAQKVKENSKTVSNRIKLKSKIIDMVSQSTAETHSIYN